MTTNGDVIPNFPLEIASIFQTQGLTLLGVSNSIDFTDYERHFLSWIGDNNHGTMNWMENHGPLKYHPEFILPDAKSVLMVGLNYFQITPVEDKGGRIGKYAWGRDYHKVIGNKLRKIAKILKEKYPNEEFRPFTDATPLDERAFAVAAGLGFITKNTLLAAPKLGTWFLLGEILTTKYFPTSPTSKIKKSCPDFCKRCIHECPTGALSAPHSIDARKCISYLTIEYKGLIPVELRSLMGDWVFGCDLCQDLCPLNLRCDPTSEPDFLNWKAGSTIDIMEILTMHDEAIFKTRFAGSPLIRAGLRMMKRNCCIAAGNSRKTKYIDVLKSLSMDQDLLIAHHALWGLEKILNFLGEKR